MVRIVPKRIPLDRWIEDNIHLPQGLTAEPGPIKLGPYMREIARAIGDPKIERVSLMKSARIGFTTVMTGMLAYHIVEDPAPVLVLLPCESDARDYAITDFENTLLDSPTIAPLLPMPAPGRSTRVTILHRPFPGGSIKFVAGQSPRNLRRHTWPGHRLRFTCDHINHSYYR
jgi:phage terminase large subunit GpA-like protein